MERDPSLDALLDLDGQVLVVDSDARYWVRFVVQRIPATLNRPHGLNYTLTLHGLDGKRVAGFDNAHAIKGGTTVFDHRHRYKTVRPYEYKDAATLLADFWALVDDVLREEGIS